MVASTLFVYNWDVQNDAFRYGVIAEGGFMTIWECGMSLSEGLNLAALVIVPIAAVVIGQRLQTRAKKREDRMRVFEAMMASKLFGMSVETARAANMIHVTFSRDECVRTRWAEYYKSLCIKNPNAEQLREIEGKRDAMLKAMASSLGYKDKVSQDAIDTKYVPKGIIDARRRSQMQQNYYDYVLQQAASRFAFD